MDEKPRNKEPEAQKQGKHRKSEGKSRRGNSDASERRPYEEVPVSNIVIQEVSILDPENDRALLAKQKKKIKSGQKKETKEQKRQQQQQLVKEPQPVMKLSDFELAEVHSHDNSFTRVESKAHKFLRKGNKVEPAPVNDDVMYQGSLDRLDEISISGPRPDGREGTRKSEASSKVKPELRRIDVPQRRKSQQHVVQQLQGTKVRQLFL